MVAGYPHHLFGKHTPVIGLGLYVTNVYLAILIEALFIAVLLWFFFKR
jgi:ABC-type Na+ efflux pump permease subunit